MGKTQCGGERERDSQSPEYHIWGSLLLLDGFLYGKEKDHTTRRQVGGQCWETGLRAQHRFPWTAILGAKLRVCRHWQSVYLDLGSIYGSCYSSEQALRAIFSAILLLSRCVSLLTLIELKV